MFKRSVSLVLLLFFVFASANVYAAPVSLPQTVSPGFFSTSWTGIDQITTTTGAPYTGTCVAGTGFGIWDANGPAGSGDAYDAAYLVFVDGAVFAPGSTVDLTDTTITAGPVAMSGLNVTVQYYFDTLAAVARIMVFLNNPTGSTINATVDIPVNLGSDSSSIVQMTSSGDTTFATDDRWVVTSDSGPSDPVNTTVLYGPNASVIPSAYTQTVFDCAATNGIGATYDVSVPANQTRSLMLFAGLGDITGNGNTIAGAIASAALFDSLDTLPSGSLDGLTPLQLSQVVNWSIIAVPTMNEWGMIIFMAVAGLGSIYYLRKYKKV
ncbi:MAG: hypothetical protein HZC48_00195 [Nitrospirae bacterium]|nr:hypothetical protein [Nitrospirota bacterium]